jgi:hypothetical protein
VSKALKPLGPTEAAIRRIAMDVGKQVVEHIEHAHSEMTRAVSSWKSSRLSIRNATYNAIMAAVEAADKGRDQESIADNDRHRRVMRKLRKARTIDEVMRATRGG